MGVAQLVIMPNCNLLRRSRDERVKYICIAKSKKIKIRRNEIMKTGEIKSVLVLRVLLSTGIVLIIALIVTAITMFVMTISAVSENKRLTDQVVKITDDLYMTKMRIEHSSVLEPAVNITFGASVESDMRFDKYDRLLIESHDLKFPDAVPSSVFNANLALAFVGGVVLEPGKEFSFNEVAWNYDSSRAYKMGPFISGEPYKGGGIDKAATAIFQTARKAGLAIIERHDCAPQSNYALSGDDASVSNDNNGYDLKFKNNTSDNLVFEGSIYDNTAHIRLYKLVPVQEEKKN